MQTNTQKDQILDILSDEEWHNGFELFKQTRPHSLRYGGRIHELRQEGYIIEREFRPKFHTAFYRLVGTEV